MNNSIVTDRFAAKNSSTVAIRAVGKILVTDPGSTRMTDQNHRSLWICSDVACNLLGGVESIRAIESHTGLAYRVTFSLDRLTPEDHVFYIIDCSYVIQDYLGDEETMLDIRWTDNDQDIEDFNHNKIGVKDLGDMYGSLQCFLSEWFEFSATEFTPLYVSTRPL